MTFLRSLFFCLRRKEQNPEKQDQESVKDNTSLQGENEQIQSSSQFEETKQQGQEIEQEAEQGKTGSEEVKIEEYGNVKKDQQKENDQDSSDEEGKESEDQNNEAQQTNQEVNDQNNNDQNYSSEEEEEEVEEKSIDNYSDSSDGDQIIDLGRKESTDSENHLNTEEPIHVAQKKPDSMPIILGQTEEIQDMVQNFEQQEYYLNEEQQQNHEEQKQEHEEQQIEIQFDPNYTQIQEFLTQRLDEQQIQQNIDQQQLNQQQNHQQQYQQDQQQIQGQLQQEDQDSDQISYQQSFAQSQQEQQLQHSNSNDQELVEEEQKINNQKVKKNYSKELFIKLHGSFKYLMDKINQGASKQIVEGFVQNWQIVYDKQSTENKQKIDEFIQQVNQQNDMSLFAPQRHKFASIMKYSFPVQKELSTKSLQQFFNYNYEKTKFREKRQGSIDIDKDIKMFLIDVLQLLLVDFVKNNFVKEIEGDQIIMQSEYKYKTCIEKILKAITEKQ